jgi:hypothetical protein
MKAAFFLLFIFIHSFGFGQSPYLSVKAEMDSISSFHYKIEMKICELKKPGERGDWFSHDTSAINFASLKVDDIICGDYFETDDPQKPADNFSFGNQVFAFEKILLFKITDVSHRNWIRPMYVVVPIKNKSFVTFINLNQIKFKEDCVIYFDEVQRKPDGTRLQISKSLKNHATTKVNNFSMKEIL